MKSHFQSRKDDIDKSFKELKHEPNIHLASIRKQLCFFKLFVYTNDLLKEQKKDNEKCKLNI